MDRNEKQNSYRTPHVTRNSAGAGKNRKKGGNSHKAILAAAGVLAVAILAGGGYFVWNTFGPGKQDDETANTRVRTEEESVVEDQKSETEYEPGTEMEGLVSGSDITDETEGLLIPDEKSETEGVTENAEAVVESALDPVLGDGAVYRLTSIDAQGNAEILGQNCADPAEITYDAGEITSLLAVGTFYEKLGTGIPEDIDLGSLANEVLGKEQSNYTPQDRTALEDMICHIGASVQNGAASDGTEDAGNIGSDENFKKGMAEILDFVSATGMRASVAGELKDGYLDTEVSMKDLETFFANLAGCGDWEVWTEGRKGTLYGRTAEEPSDPEKESELVKAIRKEFSADGAVHWAESGQEDGTDAVMMIDGDNGAHWFFGIQGTEMYDSAQAKEIAQALAESVNGG